MLKQAAWSSDPLPLRNHGGYNSAASNAGSVSSNDRLAHLMLNPILHSSANKLPKYAPEEMHFIQYFREDKGIHWPNIVGPFNAQFPNHKRQRSGLECRYYRFKLYPKVNEEGTFQYDDKGEIVMVNMKVRDRKNIERSGGKKSVLNDYVKLVSSCPEKVVEYAWTDVEDKKRARVIIQQRKETALTQLRGALLRSRSSL